MRITITAAKFNYPEGTTDNTRMSYWTLDNFVSTERYCSINALYAFNSGYSGNGMNFTLETANLNNPTTWTTITTSIMNGGSGTSFVLLPNATAITFGGYGTSQSRNNWFWRFTFFTRQDTSSTVTSGVSSIVGVGPNTWSSSDDMLRFNHLYGWDINKNATFPANLTVKGDLKVTGNIIPNNYELIETITLTDDTAAAVTRTAEPNGTAYNFSKAIIICSAMLANGVSGRYGLYVNSDINHPYGITDLVAGGTKMSVCEAEIRNGYVFCKTYTISDKKNYSADVEYIPIANTFNGQAAIGLDTVALKQADSITSLRIAQFNTRPFASGTVFKIYAVRI